jgi:hypothetical protein
MASNSEAMLERLIGDLEVNKAEIVTAIRELRKAGPWPERRDDPSVHRMVAAILDRVSRRLEGDAGSVREIGRNHSKAAGDK